MSANNNDPHKNPAASSIFGQSIRPSNPNAHLQSQPHSIFGPQQHVTSDARASSSPFGHCMPSNPSAHLQSQQQSVFGQNSMPFTNPTAHLQSQVQQSIFGQYYSMPSNPAADLRSQLQQSMFGPLALQPSASTFMKQLNISYGYAQVIARAQTKVQAIAIAHAHLNAQIQAINQSHELPNHQAPPSHSHMNGGNSVNSAGHGSSDSNLVQGRCSSTQNNGQKNETVSSPSNNNEADHAGGKGNGSVTAIAKSEVDAKQSPQSDGTNISNRGKNGKGKSSNALDDSKKRCLDLLRGPDGELPHKLRNIEPCFIEKISNEIMDVDPNVRWDDIAGLYHVKNCVNEMVILPLLRPDIFKDCRSPGRGLLLFGPPGTGKTMIGKAIAGEAKATFFYISASSITSKWMGESEKLVRALFGVASCRQPAVIFVDEIDSLLSKRRSDYEQESSRRIKTQFLIEMEGFNSGSEQVLLIGATNRPQDLDEAARRRLTKRLYIPLPSSEARASIVRNVLSKDDLYKLSSEDIDSICKFTEGYSGSDMTNLVKDASMGPIREALRQGADITNLKKEDMRPVTLQDFEDALQEVRPSVFLNELGAYEEWNKQFGSLSPSTV